VGSRGCSAPHCPPPRRSLPSQPTQQQQRRRVGRRLKRDSAKGKGAAAERDPALELKGARDQGAVGGEAPAGLPSPPSLSLQPLCCPSDTRRLAAQLSLSPVPSVPLDCDASATSSPCHSGPLPVLVLAGSGSAPESPVAADGGSVCSSVVSSSSGGESSSGAAHRPPRRGGLLATKGSCLSVSSLSAGDGGRASDADSASSKGARAAPAPAPAPAQPAPSPFAAVASLPPVELVGWGASALGRLRTVGPRRRCPHPLPVSHPSPHPPNLKPPPLALPHQSELRLTPRPSGPDAGTAPPPAISPAKARLIAQLRRRQSERELEAAAAAAGEALCTGPRLPPAEQGLVLVSGGSVIPHVAKAATGGEDAFFVTDAGHGALGVADGVSSWAADGVNPGDYSRTLVQVCACVSVDR
jgi:hypothetical protein